MATRGSGSASRAAVDPRPAPMSLSLDPEIAAAISAPPTAAAPPIGDVATRRRRAQERMAASATKASLPAGVTLADHRAAGADGELALRWYELEGSSPGSAALYLHGGGRIAGSIDLYDHRVARYVAATGVPLLAVDYRLAPEHPGLAATRDALTGLVWLGDRAGDLGVDPARLAVMGESAGGGLATVVAAMARDGLGPPAARQILVAPMLDDRTARPDPEVAPFATWTYEDNLTAWQAVLGEDVGGRGVSPFVAPARATELVGLPAAYIEVGELDIFRPEAVRYAERLLAAGTSVELHVHPGAPHLFESLAPESAVARRAFADRVRILRSL